MVVAPVDTALVAHHIGWFLLVPLAGRSIVVWSEVKEISKDGQERWLE
jgi:hypothetical protein